MGEALDAAERELGMALMRADLEDEQADTAHEPGLFRHEPWKVVTTASGAGFALCGGLAALLTSIIARLH